MDKERKLPQDDDFDDDDLFEGLSEEDYHKNDKDEEDDLSEGYVHETLEDEESDLYQYQNEDEEKSAYGEAGAAVGKTSMLDQFKERFRSGNLSQKARSLVVPLLFGALILGFCIYKIAGLFASPSPKVVTTHAGVNVRQYIARPQKPREDLDLSDNKSITQQPETLKNSIPEKKVAQVQATLPLTDLQTGKADQDEEDNLPAAIPNTINSEKMNDKDSNNTKPDVIANIGTPKKTVVEEKNVPVTVQAASPPPAAPAVSTPAADEATRAALTALQADQAQDKERIQSLETQLNTMSKEFADLNKKLQGTLVALEKQITALNEARLHQQQVDVLNKKAQAEYTIQAIIPGRAWLKTQENKMITVTQGDTIPGYGSVSDIDVDNGLVRTELGAVFTYALGQ